MSSVPPASAIKSGRLRIQAARQAQRAAVLIIAGQSIQANAWISEETPELEEGGFKRTQRLEATILKSRLASRPTERMEITHQASGLSFRVIEFQGDNATDVVWRITAMRIITPSAS